MVESAFVESAALDIVRLRRARRLEVEYIPGELNPPLHGPAVLGDEINWSQVHCWVPDSQPRLVSRGLNGSSVFFNGTNRLLPFDCSGLLTSSNDCNVCGGARRYRHLSQWTLVFMLTTEYWTRFPRNWGSRKFFPAMARACRHLPLWMLTFAETGTVDSALAALEQTKALPGDES